MVRQHFGVVHAAGGNRLHQHFGGIGVYQAGGDFQVFNPQFFQFEINGFTVHTHHGHIAARFHHFLTHIPSYRQADRFNGHIHTVLTHNIQYLLAHIARSRIHGMRCTQFLRQFQAVFVHIAHNQHARTVQLRREQCRHAHRTRTGNKHRVAWTDIAILHANFVCGRQRVRQQQRHFFVYAIRKQNQAVVRIRRAHKFGLCAVNHIAQNPTAVAAVGIELLFAVVASAAFRYAGNDDFVAFFDVFHGRTDFFHNADTFVPQNPTGGNFGIFALPNAQIRAANGGFGNTYHCIGRINNARFVVFFKTDIAFAVVNHCFHDVSPFGLRFGKTGGRLANPPRNTIATLCENDYILT